MVDLDLSDSEFLFKGDRCQLFLQLDNNAVSEALVMNKISFSYFTPFFRFPILICNRSIIKGIADADIRELSLRLLCISAGFLWSVLYDIIAVH